MEQQSGHGLGATRARVLQSIQQVSEPLTVPQIAEQLFLHPNSVRFHLDALIELGYVVAQLQKDGTQGRPKMAYQATGKSPNVSNQHLVDLSHLLIKNFVATLPDGHERANAAGYSWGMDEARNIQCNAAREQVEALSDSMTERGFATVSASDHIDFIRCPFRSDALTENEMRVICATHIGFIEGFVEQSGDNIHSPHMAIGTSTCTLAFKNTDLTHDND